MAICYDLVLSSVYRDSRLYRSLMPEYRVRDMRPRIPYAQQDLISYPLPFVPSAICPTPYRVVSQKLHVRGECQWYAKDGASKTLTNEQILRMRVALGS